MTNPLTDSEIAAIREQLDKPTPAGTRAGVRITNLFVLPRETVVRLLAEREALLAHIDRLETFSGRAGRGHQQFGVVRLEPDNSGVDDYQPGLQHDVKYDG